MKILAIDIGTGTQDILLYDSRIDIENNLKLVLPSPTMQVKNRLNLATRLSQSVVLSGVMMGGGPSTWGVEYHIRSRLPLYATPEAARTFNDDLDQVQEMGITLVGEDEVVKLSKDSVHILLSDFNIQPIQRAFAEFGVSINDLSAVAVAVFDHGSAPAHVSDRQFRFDYLDDRIRTKNRLSAFAFLSGQIPLILTRLQAVANSAKEVQCPLIVMDTAPAAVLGASFDPFVSNRKRCIITNIGNFHTLAFRLGDSGIEGVFEHHTGLLDQNKLETLLKSLANGSLTHQEVFNSNGHGALVYSPRPLELNNNESNIIVTGPRRNLLRGSELNPYFAVPFGDMMLSGCYGLLSATAELIPDLQSSIQASLSANQDSGIAPWDN
jgi:uncharacterized protein (DUF1786 family)